MKQCGNSRTGSFKDLGMTVLVSAVREMIRRGRSVRAVACASTGDTSAALSAYCAAAAARTAASAIQIGAPVSIDRAVKMLRATDGVVEQATEDELADTAARADATGMYNRPHTAVALAALEKLVKAGTIAPDERVVVVSTARGLTLTEFKRAYHEGSLEGVTSRHANRPIELPADVDAVRRAIDARLGG